MKMTARVAMAAACGAVAVAGVMSAPAAHAQSSSRCNYTNSQPTLSLYSTGIAVKQVQCELNNSLYDADPTTSALNLVVDGSFGSKTRASVLKLQRCARLQEDAIVGARTWAVLNSWTVSPYFIC